MVNLDFGSLKTTRVTFGNLDFRTVPTANSTVHTLLSLVEDVCKGTTVHASVNSKMTYA
jgi:hypothetical protein